MQGCATSLYSPQGNIPKLSQGALTSAAQGDVEVVGSPKPLESTENDLFLVAGQKQSPVSRIAINDPAVLVLSIFLSLSLSMCLNIIYIFRV